MSEIFKALKKNIEELEKSVMEYNNLCNAPKINSRWVRNNNTFDTNIGHYNGYIILFITNTDHLHEDHEPQVVYKGDNGKYWSLPLNKWPGNLRKETDEESKRQFV